MIYLDWHVGMKVVCVRNSVARINDMGFPAFSKGQVLTISGMEMVEPYGLFLSFYERDWRNTGHVLGFRPVQTRKTSIDVFTALLHDNTEKAPA